MKLRRLLMGGMELSSNDASRNFSEVLGRIDRPAALVTALASQGGLVRQPMLSE